MSHRMIAAIWERLQNRIDAPSILQEIIGQQTLELLDHSEYSVAAITNALQPVLWIKIIFDLQRAYLQATAGVIDCIVPGLLPNELIYSTLMYLLHIKPKLFPDRDPEPAPKWIAEHMIMAHTLLSGIRLLLLRKEPIAPEKLRRLEETLAAVWSGQSNSPECEFIVHGLFPEALDAESPTENQAGSDYAAGLRAVGIPTFAEGLYPVSVRPMMLTSRVFPRLKADVNWLKWYWILFDSIHACECALVQAHLDLRPRNLEAANLLGPPTQPLDVLAQLKNARRNIIAAVFASPPRTGEALPGAAILNSMNATIIWQEDPASSNLDHVSEKQAMDFSFALKSFATWLSERSARMHVTQQTPHRIHRSMPPTTLVSPQRHAGLPPSPAQRAEDYLDRPSSSDAGSVTHTTTSGSTSSTAGRPRSLVINLASEDLPSSTVLSSGSTSRSQSEDHMSGLSPQKESCNSRGLTLRRAFKMSKEKHSKIPETCRPTSFCFSADGKSLALWGGNFRGFARFGLYGRKDAVVDGSMKWELAAVKQVAIGSERCVVLASHQERFKLVSFYKCHPFPEAQIDLEIPLKHYTESSITVCQQDTLAAFAANGTIEVFRLTRGHIAKIKVHDQTNLYQHLAAQRRFAKGPGALSSREAAQEAEYQSTVVERRLNFSPSGNKLVVATQLADHCVYVDVFDCKAAPCVTITSNPYSFKLPPWTSNDGGLTTAFFDDSYKCAILTAFISKEYPCLIPMGEKEIAHDGDFGSKVVYAAQSPSGGTFVIANGMAEIIHLTFKPSAALSARKLKKSTNRIPSSAFKPGNIALGMPDRNTVYAFWIKDTKLILRTVQVGEVDSYSDTDLRYHVDRLHCERSDPVLLSSNSVAPGTAYREPIMLDSEPSPRELHGDHIVELPAEEKGR